MNRHEVHDVLGHWRELADSYEPERVLLGETYVLDSTRLARFYGSGADELHLAFNFVFMLATFDAGRARADRRPHRRAAAGRGLAVWTISNHDVARAPTRWAGDDEDAARAALVLLFALRGTPVLYYGDELGLREADVPPERVKDPVGLQGVHPGRDGARTPMPWTGEEGARFTAPGVEPWLPFGDLSRNVAAQREDPGSMLHLCRDLIALRRSQSDLVEGAYTPLEAPEGAWAFARGEGHAVALNLAPEPRVVEGLEGEVVLASRRGREGEAIDGRITLAPWDAVVLRTRA